MSGLGRRDFLRRTALAGGSLLAPSLTGLISCAELREYIKGKGYGRLHPSADVNGIISLPRHFHAALLSTAGDPMIDGTVPIAFDGMAAFAAGGDLVRLVRNHEVRDTPEDGARPFGPNPYDKFGPAGTTTVELRVAADGRPRLVRQFASLAGTSINCAGGPTPGVAGSAAKRQLPALMAGGRRTMATPSRSLHHPMGWSPRCHSSKWVVLSTKRWPSTRSLDMST